MRQSLLILGTVVTLVVGGLAHAEVTPAEPPALGRSTFASREEAKAACQAFVQRVVDGHVSDAFDAMAPYWPVPSEEFDALKLKAMKQLSLLAGRFGQPLQAALVDERAIAESIVLLVFLEKCERHVLRWRFILYQPRDRWQLNALAFDDNIDAFFE